MVPDRKETVRLIRGALREDIGRGDITTESIVPSGRTGSAMIVAKGKGVICGIDAAGLVFNVIDKRLKARRFFDDGSKVEPGDVVMEIRGSMRSILKAERVALNLLCRLSGIATLTGKFADAVKGAGARIYDTRKTTPLLRGLEKYAVRTGGGFNHRFGLYDMVLIKDNHVDEAGGVAQAVKKARRKNKGVPVEVEARTYGEAKNAVDSKADIILLDNMGVKELKRAIGVIGKMAKIEISGGVNLKNVRQLAGLGVDRISVGMLTHSPGTLDFSLKIK